MFVPGIPNGFPSTESNYDAYKPLPSPPPLGMENRNNSHGPHSRAKIRKQPLADKTTNVKNQKVLKKSTSLDKITGTAVDTGQDPLEYSIDPLDSKLTALPRQSSSIKLPGLFRSAAFPENAYGIDNDVFSSNLNYQRVGEPTHKHHHKREPGAKDAQKHRPMLDKFKDVISERLPNITSSNRRRQNRHTVIFDNTEGTTASIGFLADAQDDAKRRMAEERNFGSPKLQRMLDSPHKSSITDKVKRRPNALHLSPSSSRYLSNDGILSTDHVEEEEGYFWDDDNAVSSLSPLGFVPFEFGLGPQDTTVVNSVYTARTASQVEISGEGAYHRACSLGIKSVDDSNQVLDDGNGISPPERYDHNESGLRQHRDVLKFASSPEGNKNIAVDSQVHTSTTDRRRRNGLHLAHSPLKKMHTLSDASGKYEYVPSMAVLSDGNKFFKGTGGASAALDDRMDIDITFMHSKQPSDTSKRNSKEAGFFADCIPTKKSKINVDSIQSTFAKPVADDCSEDDSHADDHESQRLLDIEKESVGNVDNDYIMHDADCSDDEPIIEVARTVKLPSARERRQSNYSHGNSIFIHKKRTSPQAHMSEIDYQSDDVDELEAPDPRFTFSKAQRA